MAIKPGVYHRADGCLMVVSDQAEGVAGRHTNLACMGDDVSTGVVASPGHADSGKTYIVTEKGLADAGFELEP